MDLVGTGAGANMIKEEVSHLNRPIISQEMETVIKT